MAILKKGLKLGTALGITYLSVNQRLWSQLSHEEINNKLAIVCDYEKQLIAFIGHKTGLKVTDWLPKESLNVKNVWNSCAKTSMKTLSQINLNELSTKLQKMFK